ncbi:MAG: SMC-Scp complex subunit ScpB [Clostridia bacterium]|nr:SMC-Scp complex subunit ScpB [Clostridia bacterium]
MMENLVNIIEAVLFASGKAVAIKDISEKLGVSENKVKDALTVLKERYTVEGGIQLLEFNKKAQLASNPVYKDSIAAVLNPIREKELTRTILECAAIIAYKQPITRTEIEMLRGVSSDYGVNALVDLGLIYPCGRKDAIGHPVLFATTDEFLKRFKLNSLEDLPDYDQLMAAIARPDDERDSYLYARGEWENIDADSSSTLGSEPQAPTEKAKKQPQKEEVVEGGYEIPDFLKGLDDTDIVKIS